jgi:hypothetical protein
MSTIARTVARHCRCPGKGSASATFFLTRRFDE